MFAPPGDLVILRTIPAPEWKGSVRACAAVGRAAGQGRPGGTLALEGSPRSTCPPSLPLRLRPLRPGSGPCAARALPQEHPPAHPRDLCPRLTLGTACREQRDNGVPVFSPAEQKPGLPRGRFQLLQLPSGSAAWASCSHHALCDLIEFISRNPLVIRRAHAFQPMLLAERICKDIASDLGEPFSFEAAFRKLPEQCIRPPHTADQAASFARGALSCPRRSSVCVVTVLLLSVRTLTLPDVFIDHDEPERMYEGAGLDAGSSRAPLPRAARAPYPFRPTSGRDRTSRSSS